jgi:hypothetical protein
MAESPILFKLSPSYKRIIFPKKLTSITHPETILIDMALMILRFGEYFIHQIKGFR